MDAKIAKEDSKSLGKDMKEHAAIAADRVREGAHKAGVALGVSERTPGEKLGHGIQKTTDTMTGHRRA